MSSREHQRRIVSDALKAVGIPDHEDMAGEVLDSILPQITRSEQLLGVPENSLLTDRGGDPWRWHAGRLNDWHPATVLDRVGPLTVAWMP